MSKLGDIMTKIKSALAYAEQIGERLKQARLNQNLTQAELAQFVGVSRKTIMAAEKGHAQLEMFIPIMMALNLTEQLDLFLPPQPISPIQLMKLQGKKRQRASGQRTDIEEEELEW